MTRIATATVKGFSLGLNTYDPVTTLKAGSLSDCGNINIFGHGIGTKLGRTQLYNSGNPFPIHSEFQFIKLATGLKYMITGQLGNVYANGVLIDTNMSGEPLSFAVINDLLHYADGLNRIRVWDSTSAPSDLAGAQIPDSIFSYKGCLFLCGMLGAPNSLRWSDANDPTTWPTANQVHLNDNDTMGLVGAAEYFNQLAVFKKTKIYFLDGLPILTNTMTLPTTNGAVSRLGIVVTPQGPGWVSADGFYVFSDGLPNKVSLKIDPVFAALNTSRHPYIRAEYLNNIVTIAAANGSTLWEDTLLQWDTKKGGWTVWPAYNASSIANIFDASDRLVQVHGSRDGKVHRAFYGTDDNGSGYMSWAKMAPILFSSEVTLLEVVIFVELWALHGIDLTYNLDNGTYVSPTINFPNPDTGAVFDVAMFDQSYFAGGTVYRIPKRIGGRCRQIEMQFFTPGPNQPWKLHRVEVNYLPGGR